MAEDGKWAGIAEGQWGWVGPVLKISTALVPSVGGAVSASIDECLRRSTGRAFSKAIDQLAKRVESLSDRISSGGLNEDAVADAVKTFLSTVSRTSREEKLIAAANLLANQLLKDGDKDKLDFTERDHFARCLDALSIGAIKVLGVAYDMTRSKGFRRNQIGEYEFAAQDLVPRVAEMPPQLAMSLVGELAAFRLMHARDVGVSLFAEGYATNEALRLTAIGERFVEYVLRAGESEDKPKGV